MTVIKRGTDPDAVRRHSSLSTDDRSTVACRRDKVAPLSAEENLK